MKLLIVSGMYPPMRTGTAFYAHNIASALMARGHQVQIVALKQQADCDGNGDLIKPIRLPAFRVPLPGFFKHFRISSLHLTNYPKLLRIARDSNAQAIILVNHYLDIAFPAIYAARQAGIPLVCSVGTQLQSLNPRRERLLNFMDRLICGRLIFPACDKIIAWDSQILKYLDDVHGTTVTGKTVIVNYGVNGNSESFLKHWHSYQLHNQILGVGAVSEQRSFLPLVRAFHLLAAEFPLLRLKIIGHIYFDEAVRLASELGLSSRITFTGEMPHDQVLEEMGASDVLYSSLTGKYLGLGTATIESMLMGLPTAVNTPLDLLGAAVLEDKQHILHCPGSSDVEIAACLREAISDEQLRKRVGEGGRQFIQDNMNWGKVAQDMEAAIMPLIH